MIINRPLAAAAIVATVAMVGCGTNAAASQAEGFWDGPGRSEVELKADGTAEGNDGCNDVAGRWRSTSATAGIFRITETSEMGCGVTGWLDGEAATYEISGDTLVIRSDDQQVLAELTRQD